MKNLCIIPARGGSKRIPKKNIKKFLGKPIITYSIEAAVKSELFDEIMVSSDDKEIVEVALRFGANVPFLRSKKNSDDYATIAQVIKEVFENYQNNNIKFDNICCILPTAPLITKGLILKGYKELHNNDFDSVRVIQAYPYPILRAYKMTHGYLSYLCPEYSKSRSQDMESYYHDAGVYYWIKTKSLSNNLKLGGVLVSEMDAHDIDTNEDWEIAEFKYLFKQRRK
jgi:pseudaminic acid cytidylyltransferase